MLDALSETVPACIDGAEGLYHQLMDKSKVRIVVE